MLRVDNNVLNILDSVLQHEPWVILGQRTSANVAYGVQRFIGSRKRITCRLHCFVHFVRDFKRHLFAILKNCERRQVVFVTLLQQAVMRINAVNGFIKARCLVCNGCS